MSLLRLLLKPLQKNNALKNPAFWKRCQLFITLLAGFLPLLASLFPVFQVLLDKDIVGNLLAGIAGINVYLTVATTDKVGL